MKRRSTRAEQWRRKADHGPPRPDDRYATRSKAPLHILIFLAPLILLYEIGSVIYLNQTNLNPQDPAVQDIKAHKLLADLFQLLGTGGIILPAFLLIAILLFQHAINRDRFKLRPSTLAIMWLEAIAWTIPLLVLGQLLFRLLGGDAAPIAAAASTATADPLASLNLGSRITIAIGAGLYEELLFRLIGIALLHTILHDAFRLKHTTSATIALLTTSISFAAYHTPADGFLSAHTGFYTAAGLFFGFLYVTRGLGIAVAVHVLYDLAVLVILPR